MAENIISTAELFAQPKETLSTEELFGKKPGVFETLGRTVAQLPGAALKSVAEPLSDTAAVLQDVLTMPSRISGYPHPPMISKFATEIVPTVLEKAATPLFPIPIGSLENIKKVFKGNFKNLSTEEGPSAIDIGWYSALIGYPAFQHIVSRQQWNSILSKLIQTERFRGTIMENMPAIEKYMTSAGIKLRSDLPIDKKFQVVISQAQKSPTFTDVLLDLERGKITPKIPTPGPIPMETTATTEISPIVPGITGPQPVPTITHPPIVVPTPTATPKPPIVEASTVKGIVEQAGAKFLSISELKDTLYLDEKDQPTEPTVWFNDPSNSTHVLPLSQVTPENVKAKFSLPTKAPIAEKGELFKNIKSSAELGLAPVDYKAAYGTDQWIEIWKEHPELQDQMIEHTRQMKAGEAPPGAQFAMEPGQAPPQQTFAFGKEEGRVEPGKPKEEGATYSVFDLMNREGLSLEQLVDALKKAVATHSRDIANLQYVLREDFADLLPARQERPSPTGLKGIGRSGVIADEALLEMKNYMFNPAKHDLKTWLNNNAFAAVSRTIMRMRVATGSAYDAAMAAKYKKVEKGLAEELKRQPTIEEIANKAQFQKNPKNNLLKTQELRDLITFGEGKISYEEGIEYKERLTGRQRVTPPPQYSVSEDDYDSVFDGGLGVTETRFSKVIPPTTATGESITFPKEGGRHLSEIYEREIGPVLQMSKRMKKWLGVYYGSLGKGSGLIRVKNLENLKVLSHETGHFLDDVLHKYPVIKNLRDELIRVAKYATPFEEQYIIGKSEKTGKVTKRQDPYTTYRKQRSELFADYVSVYIAEPGKCKELAPIFTAQVENEILKNKEFAWIVTKMREYNVEFQKVIDWVNEQRKVPDLDEAFKPWIQKGNLLENLWTDKVADPVINKLKGFWYAFEQTLIGRPISWIFTERKGIPKLAWELLTQRKLLITGQVARAAEELIKPISKLSAEDQEWMWDALQRFDILAPDSLKNTLTEEGRKEFAVWGNESRKLGLLGEEAFWNWAGQYMKWMYTSKEFSENTAKYGAGWMKTLRINLRQFKHRLTDEEMGRKVLEAKYPWHKKNPSQQALIDAYSKADLIKLGQDVRKEMGLMKTVAYPMEKALRYMINSVYTAKALNAIATIPGMIGDREMPNYVQLAKGRGLGNLSGQYVPKTLADEINSFSEKTNILIQILEAPVQVWKAFKVPWNPAAAFSRNPITNALQGWMDNFPSYNPVVVLKGMKTFITKTGGYKAIRDHGQYNKNYNSEELKTLAFLAESPSDHPLAIITKWAVKIFNTPSEAYGAIEDCSKTILAQYVLDHGGTPMQAVRYANEILFDYSVVSPLVGLVRQGPFPFITWSAKVFPNLVKTAIRRPQKYIFVWLALLVATAYSRRRLGITEKEEESMKPEYLKDRMVFLHSSRDENGNLQWTDLSYFLPWGGWTTPVKGSAIPQIFQIGNPLMTLYNAYVQNYDPFIGQIGKDWMTEEEQRQAKKEYIEQSLAPNISPWGKGFDRIVKAIKKEPVGRYRQVDSLGKVLGGELLGFRTATGSETTTRVTKWEEEQKRAKIEVNRPAKLAWEAYYMDPTPENYKLAVEVNKKVAFKDRQRIKMKAKKDIKLLKRKDSAWQGLSQPQKNKFRKYQRTLK